MQKVRVYWNLHKYCWSIQSCKTNKVIDYKQHLTLGDGYFVVRKGGQKRVRQRTKGWDGIDDYEKGSKNVHAFAVGYISNEQDSDSSPYYWRITYNPYKDDFFRMAGIKEGYIDKTDHLTFLGSGEVRRDFVGNIYMESLHHENGIAPRVYV